MHLLLICMMAYHYSETSFCQHLAQCRLAFIVMQTGRQGTAARIECQHPDDCSWWNEASKLHDRLTSTDVLVSACAAGF